MFEPEEEIIEISVSPIIITLSMEVVYSIRKPISKAFNNEMVCLSKFIPRRINPNPSCYRLLVVMLKNILPWKIFGQQKKLMEKYI